MKDQGSNGIGVDTSAPKSVNHFFGTDVSAPDTIRTLYVPNPSQLKSDRCFLFVKKKKRLKTDLDCRAKT